MKRSISIGGTTAVFTFAILVGVSPWADPIASPQGATATQQGDSAAVSAEYAAPWRSLNACCGKAHTGRFASSWTCGQAVIGQAATSRHAAGFGFWYGAVSEPQCDCGRQGDVTSGGIVNAVDVVYMICYALRAACPAPPADAHCPCLNRGDWDCGGTVSLSDVIRMVNYVYRSGPRPSDPCATEQ